MKVTAILRNARADKKGLCPVVIRINAGQKRYFRTTDIKILPSQFKKGKVTNHPDEKRLNAELKRRILEVDDSDNYSQTKFEDYAKDHIRMCEQKKTRSDATISYYNTELKKFIAFAGKINLSEVTPSLLEKYHAHLAKENSNNTIWKALKFIKTIINKAIDQDLISKNPFKKISDPIKYEQSNRSFLTSEEVKRIADAKFGNHLSMVRDWFLFQCETGLAISDIRKVDLAKAKKEKMIILSRTKTTVPVAIPLSAGAEKIIKRLKPLSISDQEYNRSLKTIASNADVNKLLTSHMGRHTAAMRMAELGISKEVAAKILGHKKLSTTDIYYRVQDERVKKEFKNFGY